MSNTETETLERKDAKAMPKITFIEHDGTQHTVEAEIEVAEPDLEQVKDLQIAWPPDNIAVMLMAYWKTAPTVKRDPLVAWYGITGRCRSIEVVGAPRRGDDHDVMAPLLQAQREVVHLHLDAADLRQVAVCDEADLQLTGLHDRRLAPSSRQEPGQP